MKVFKKNWELYFLFLVDTLYVTKNGYSWLYRVFAVIVLIIFIADIAEVIYNARK